jgi:hypothetical protein
MVANVGNSVEIAELKITDIRTEWLRVPISPPISDSTHELRFLDLILVDVFAGDHVGHIAICFRSTMLRDF